LGKHGLWRDIRREGGARKFIWIDNDSRGLGRFLRRQRLWPSVVPGRHRIVEERRDKFAEGS
jgi:hypothetical protein